MLVDYLIFVLLVYLVNSVPFNMFLTFLTLDLHYRHFIYVR